MSKPSPSDIAKHAYRLWEREGHPHGRDQEHWYQAEREVLGAATAEQDKPIGEIRAAQQASAQKTDAPTAGQPPKGAPPVQAAAASPSRPSQAQGQGSQTGKPTQPQATQRTSSSQQSASGKDQSSAPAKRKPRAGAKQPAP